MSILKILEYHVIILQLENYNLRRYWRALGHQYFPPQRLRQKLVWTAKLKTVAGCATFSSIAISIIIGWVAYPWIGFFVAFASAVCAPVFLTAAVIILMPLDAFLKRRVIAAARAKLIQFPRLTIIGITGSYGKTTMKEILAAILSERYAVLKTPDNINTPVGIARLIIEKLTPHIQIFIVEMGAYRRGDIATLCALTPPDISILTGINEAHLERFGNIENTIAAKFEIAQNTQKNSVIILNEDDGLIVKNYKNNVGNRKTIFYSSFAGIPVPKTKLLGDYALGALRGAMMVAEKLGVTPEQSAHAIAALTPLPHRLQPLITKQGVLIIDDSYNGNPAGVTEAIRVLSRFKNRRKIYVTPGLVETGKQNQAVHQKIGEQLSVVADLVILIKNSATIHIAEGLRAAQFKNENIIWFKSALEAHAALAGILHSGDVILFQNDWPDNYS